MHDYTGYCDRESCFSRRAYSRLWWFAERAFRHSGTGEFAAVSTL